MNFVVGFAFTPDPLPFTRVLLIEKLKPAWQAGKHNGVGGKIDQWSSKGPKVLESPIEAMVREFHEETGVLSEESDWQHYATMHNGLHEHQVFCFESREPRLYHEAETMEAERLVRIPVNGILHPASYNIIPNLRSKILIALDRESWHRPVELVYGGEHFAGKALDEAVKADPRIEG